MSNKLSVSYCHPLKADVIELGELDQEEILAVFEKIPWLDLLKEMTTASDENIYYSPSFSVERSAEHLGIEVSAIDYTEWYIFFKRPKLIGQEMRKDYLSDITEQTIEDVRECLQAFISNDLAFLEEKVS